MPNEVVVLQVQTADGRWTTWGRIFLQPHERVDGEKLQAMKPKTRILIQPIGKKNHQRQER